MIMKKLFYFAYGSNMLKERLEIRVGHIPHIETTYRLKGYKLVFNQGYKTYSYANIIPGLESDFVEGVCYELSQRQVNLLNSYEGYPYNYEHQYFILPDSNIGFAYVCNNCLYESNALPSLDYLNIMIIGAIENNLKHTANYLIDFKNTNYKLKKGNKFIKL